MTIATSALQTASQMERLTADLESPALVSVGLPAEFASRLLSEGLASLRRRSLVSWESPGRRSALFGFGEAARLSGARTSTLQDSIPRLQSASEGARSQGVPAAARPRWFGGGRFLPDGSAVDRAWDAYGGWRFIAPKVLLSIQDSEPTASLTLMSAQHESGSFQAAVERAVDEAFQSGPSTQEFADANGGFEEASQLQWERVVCEALDELRSDDMEKIVLARAKRISLECAADQGRLLTRLADRYEQCFVFSFKDSSATWLGASPELLCRVDNQAVEAESLAGSRPRGRDDADDARLADELLNSEKERTEHVLVAGAIEETLSPLCSELSVPSDPRIMKIANIQHLFTPISGSLHDGLGVMDVVSRLHPTPAVAGWPREEAIEAIDRLEKMDRGWYAGPIGWVDLDGDGEFADGL